MGYPDLTAIHEDVEKGLQSHEQRLNRAATAQAFYDYDGRRFMSAFLRDAETPFDYLMRPYRMSGLCRQIIDILCEHLYSPGPTRQWDQPTGDKFLQVVYSDNSMDALMQRADQLSTLSNVAAIQVDADEGNFQDKPLTLRLWGAQDFAVWTDPDNRTVPKCACTVDRYDKGAVYRLWTETHVSLYTVPQGQTLPGGKVAQFVRADEHAYGCLPFAFVHNVQPIVSFWEVGCGPLAVEGEIRTNDRLSRLDESVNKHLNPIPVAQNVDESWNPIVEPMRFIRVKGNMMRPGPTGGYEDGPQPSLYFLQPSIDIAGAWDDLARAINQWLQAMGIPQSAVRMEQIGVASGIALIVEQAPLLTRARARHKPFTLYETEIARTILRCAGGHYNRPELVQAAKTGKLLVGWPQPNVPVPTKDSLELLTDQVTVGIKSLPMIVSEWLGIDREQAFQWLEQVEADNEELKRRAPTLALQGAGLPPVEEDDEDDDSKETQDDDDKDVDETGEDEDNEEADASELGDAA